MEKLGTTSKTSGHPGGPQKKIVALGITKKLLKLTRAPWTTMGHSVELEPPSTMQGHSDHQETLLNKEGAKEHY